MNWAALIWTGVGIVIAIFVLIAIAWVIILAWALKLARGINREIDSHQPWTVRKRL